MSVVFAIGLIAIALFIVGPLLLVGLLALVVWLFKDALPLMDLGGNTTTHYVPTGFDIPEKRPFVRTGDKDLPHTIRLEGKVYRWHAREYLYEGDAFFKTFEDGPWKWEAQNRFAGKGLNCGHFFGLSAEAAESEAKYYGLDPDKSVMLELEGASTRILDLTHPDVIRAMFEANVDNHTVVSWSYYNMLEELIERVKGGSVITDYMGYSAKQDGYDGIMFYGARAMDIVHVKRLDRDLEGLQLQLIFDEIRWKPHLLNVVLFSGANVVNLAHTYRIGNREPVQNQFFGKGVEDIYKLSCFDSDYQEECDRFTLYKPKYVDPDHSR